MPRRIMEGRVVGDKTNKTVTVLVERRIMDPLYKKFIRRSKKYSAHDESNVFRIGDYVSIEECPPISKSKRFKVISAAPTGTREEKSVTKALAARAIAEQNKPEAKKKVAKIATPKAAKPAAATNETVEKKKAPAKAKAAAGETAAPKAAKKKDDQ